MSEEFPMVPNANCVIVEKPGTEINLEDGGIALPQTVEKIVQLCKIVSIGEITDKDEAPFDVKVGDRVMLDTSVPDTVNLILKNGKYYISPIKCLLAIETTEDGDVQ